MVERLFIATSVSASLNPFEPIVLDGSLVWDE